MEIKKNKINYSIYFIIFFIFFFSFFTPLLNFNDLYIIKFEQLEPIGHVLKIDNHSILLSYFYVLLNILTLLILKKFIVDRFITSIHFIINYKSNLIINFSLFIVFLILIYLKNFNKANDNILSIIIYLFFYHSLISAIYFYKNDKKKYTSYLILNLILIIFYKIFVSHQIFTVYVFLTSIIYFFYICEVNFKKIVISVMVFGIILFSLNIIKFYLRNTPVDGKFISKCNFVLVSNIKSCGSYEFNKKNFKNNIVPVPPSTFKLIYNYPNNKFEYKLFSAINKGFERLLKMNYLAANISSLNHRFENKFHNNFLNGETYKLIVTKFIPRFIYKNKPNENIGQLYAKKFHYLPSYDNTTSINLDSINESYINFNFWGFVIFPLLITTFLLLIFLFIKKTDNEFKLLLISLIPILFFHSLEGNTSGWVGGLTYKFIIIIGLNFFNRFLKTN